jgi:hypothetical protein
MKHINDVSVKDVIESYKLLEILLKHGVEDWAGYEDAYLNYQENIRRELDQ